METWLALVGVLICPNDSNKCSATIRHCSWTHSKHTGEPSDTMRVNTVVTHAVHTKCVGHINTCATPPSAGTICLRRPSISKGAGSMPTPCSNTSGSCLRCTSPPHFLFFSFPFLSFSFLSCYFFFFFSFRFFSFRFISFRFFSFFSFIFFLRPGLSRVMRCKVGKSYLTPQHTHLPRYAVLRMFPPASCSS
jgi:hypothetical protein